jgi:MFS transporter, DHA2 family, multidrug resistance protein
MSGCLAKRQAGALFRFRGGVASHWLDQNPHAPIIRRICTYVTYIGGNVTPISPHVAGFVAEISFITHEWGSAELFLPQVLRGFPQVFAVAPAVNLGLGSLPPERLKYASGLFNMMRNLGGAVGIAVCGAILNDRTNLHFVMIASNLTPANGAMTRLIDGVGQRYAAVLGSAQQGHEAALKQLWRLAYREASTLAYADAFLVIMIAFIIATALVPLLRNVAAPQAPRASH